MPSNIFAMPASSIVLLFSFVFNGSNALPWTEAQQTHVYEADPWSPRPTFIPRADPATLFKRDVLSIEICGWLGGNSASAATCSPGSSCIRDTVHGVVGCCATAGPCTAGVYTSCIDMNSNGWSPNSGLQDNGIYTCSGTAVCYKNTFPGGYYQYGCGESSWATTVETTYSGQPTDMLLQQVFTGIVFTPTSGSTSTTSSSSSTSSTTSSSSSRSISASSTLPSAGKVPAQTGTTTPTPFATTTSKKNNTGAIVGGVIGGLTGLALIGAALFWFFRKRNSKECRAGPFQSAHSTGQAPTSGPFQRISPYQPYGPNNLGHSTDIAGGAFPTPYSYADAQGGPNTPPHDSSRDNIHHQFYVPHDEEPLVSEIDHFSQSYNRAIGATVPRDIERDTHIHTGDLPDTVTGLGMGVGVSPLRSTPTSSNSNGRTQDRALTSEALRSPVGSTVPRLHGFGSNTSLVNRGEGDMVGVPPRSPLRDGIQGMGASLGSAVSAVVGRDNAPRYQLVDEARDDVPILSSPGQLRGTRMSKNVSFKDKGA